MSHGSSGGDKCDPNLIPLLDLVLQLVMFFMVCANFVMEQLNESIQLPSAIAATPVGAREPYILFLNVNKQGEVILSPLDAIGDDAVLRNPIQVKAYMSKRAEEDWRATGDKTKPPRSLLIIRADKACPFEKVYGVMKACRAAGYDRTQLRAIIDN